MKLRTKLVLAWVTAGVFLTASVIWVAGVAAERAVLAEVHSRIHCSSALLNSALAASVAQRDYATLQQVLDETRPQAGIDYLVVSDRNGRRVASSGKWAESDLAAVPNGMPRWDADGEQRFHVRVDLRYGDQTFGTLHYAQSAAIVADARADLYMRSWQAALAALALGAFVLGAIAMVITRPLARLMEAAARVSQGHYDIRLRAVGSDEIARLASAFNRMCQAIRDRVAVLAEREAGEKRDREQAEAASRAKSAFLAITSHEIRTPLNGILGIAELMGRSPLPEEQRRYCEAILASGRQLHGMLSDILDFAKIEAGKLDLQTMDYDVRRLLRELAAVYAPLAADRGIRFEFECDRAIPSAVVGDPMRLRQALANLLANALKFTDSGMVSLRCSLSGPQPDACGGHDARIRIEVADTGMGIAADKVDSIFEPFYQTAESTARMYGGTGLGLCITRRLVDLMQGRIAVDSEIGRGTRITLDLPLRLGREATGAREVDASASTQPATLGGRVLVAEDHPVNQLVVAEMLRKMGASVVVVGNGRQACEALQAEHFDLVIMDCQMPEMDGHEATRSIRAGEAGGKRVPIIALTANAFAGDREACLASGMDDFLTKPIGYDELLGKVRPWLQRARAAVSENVRPATAESGHAEDIDPEALLQLARSSSPGGTARVMQAFLDSTPKVLAELASGVEARDLPALGRTAHGLRPSCRAVGLVLAARLAEDIEGKARSGDVAAFGDVRALCTALDEGAEWLKRKFMALQEASMRESTLQQSQRSHAGTLLPHPE